MAAEWKQGQEDGQGHRWRFWRVGGFDQVRLEDGDDLLALDQLDQKLWAALSCPVRGLEFDRRTLELIDTDGDGRIRVPEVLGAVRWACEVLRVPGELLNGSGALPLSSIDGGSPLGKKLLASAKQVLVNIGKPEATTITVEDTSDTARIFAQTKFNGDGVVTADSAASPATAALISEIIGCLGPEMDRSGKPGVTQAKVDQFFLEARAYADWWQKSESDPAVMPLGEATPAAADAYRAVKAKVEDFFARCRVAAFDPRATAAMNPGDPEYRVLGSKGLSASAEELLALPLARVEANRALPLDGGLNPAWSARVEVMYRSAVKPLLGERTRLTADEWQAVGERLGPYEAWLKAKAGAAVERLGIRRVREVLAGPGREAITELIVQDKATESEANSILDVERLTRYYRDLGRLLNNFLSFRDFYSRKVKAVFQAGTLYLDGRSCDLCVRVDDMARYGTLAGLSRCYLAYCDCTRRGGTDRMTIVAAFTGGDADFLMAGRNGVFYDHQGQDWDATIVKAVENPISVRQAFWSPYKHVARFVEAQIEKFAVARDQATTSQMGTAIATAGAKPEAAKTAAGQAFDIAKFAGIFAAIGLALGAIGSAVAAVLKGFLGLTAWQMPLAVAGALLVVSGPSMLLAYMKLRQRNLGPILEANGWAVNARLRINIPFGRWLTRVAVLPKGAKRSFTDPYAEKRWSRVIVASVVLALVLYYLNERGKLHQWIGVGKEVPAAQPPAASKTTGQPATSQGALPLPGGAAATP